MSVSGLLANALIPPGRFSSSSPPSSPASSGKTLGYANLSSATPMRTTRPTSPYAKSNYAAFPCLAYALPLRLKVVTGVTHSTVSFGVIPFPSSSFIDSQSPLIHNNSAFITHSFDHVPGIAVWIMLCHRKIDQFFDERTSILVFIFVV
jgi:hypothetical protein